MDNIPNEIKTAFPEVKRAFYEIKLNEEKEMSFEGHANVFNILDGANDIVEPMAFNKTLSDHGNKRGLYFAHTITLDNLVGDAFLSVDDYGLKTRGVLDDDEKGKKVHKKMKDGIINMMSIGYRVVKKIFEETEDRWIRRIKEVKLFEISVLTNAMACNEAALITSVKSMDDVYAFVNQNKYDIDFRDKLLSLFGIMPNDLPTSGKPEKSFTDEKKPGGIDMIRVLKAIKKED